MVVLLKILNGIQNGIEIHLQEGEYTLGSSSEDDIELLDSTVSPHHARLSISPTAEITITPTGAPLRVSGSAFPINDTATIAPFDIISIGAAQITLASRDDDWPAFFNALTAGNQNPEAQTALKRFLSDHTRKRFAYLLVVAPTLLASALGLIAFGKDHQNRDNPPGRELEQFIAQDPAMRNSLHVRLRPDQMPLVYGAVASEDARAQALLTLHNTRIPFDEQIVPTAELRKSIETALSSSGFSYELTPSGELHIKGLASRSDETASIRNTLEALQPPLHHIDMDIRETADFESEVRKIAIATFGDAAIDLRLDGNTMIARGDIPSAATDSWASFLLAYDSRFASTAPLRSHVTLESADSGNDTSNLSQTLTLGVLPSLEGSRPFHVQRLRDGTYGPEDLFTNRLPAPAAHILPPKKEEVRPLDLERALLADTSIAPLPALSPQRLQKMATQARDLFEAPLTGKVDGEKMLIKALKQLDRTMKDTGHEAGIAAYWVKSESDRPCWVGTHWSAATLPMAYFWIDLFIMDDDISLAAFAPNERAALAEVILNPQRSRQCSNLPSLYTAGPMGDASVARHLLSGLPTAPLKLIGRSLSRDRYLQILAGSLLHEGDQIEGATTLRSIGELGALIAQPDGPATVWYDSEFSWEVLQSPRDP